MMRLLVTVLAFSAAWAVGCGAPPPAAPAPELEAESGATAPEDVLTMRGIDLYLHDSGVTGSEARRPHFWIHAETFVMDDEDVWTFEDARAVAYNRENATEDIVFEAQSGTFEENTRAYLSGSVTAHMGSMVLHLEDIEWLNGDEETPSYAFSEKGLSVDDPEMELSASGIQIFPDDRRFEMNNVSGVIRFGSLSDAIVP